MANKRVTRYVVMQDCGGNQLVPKACFDSRPESVKYIKTCRAKKIYGLYIETIRHRTPEAK